MLCILVRGDRLCLYIWYIHVSVCDKMYYAMQKSTNELNLSCVCLYLLYVYIYISTYQISYLTARIHTHCHVYVYTLTRRALDDTAQAAQQPVSQLERMQKVVDAWQCQVCIHIPIYTCTILLFALTISSYFRLIFPLIFS